MKTIQHKFVEYIPPALEENILYVTIKYKTAVHLCACGCGNKVITPIGPNFWRLTYDGASVSLYPSIGSRNLQCRSHYFITNNKIVQAYYHDEDTSSKKKKSRNWKWFRK